MVLAVPLQPVFFGSRDVFVMTGGLDDRVRCHPVLATALVMAYASTANANVLMDTKANNVNFSPALVDAPKMGDVIRPLVNASALLGLPAKTAPRRYAHRPAPATAIA